MTGAIEEAGGLRAVAEQRRRGSIRVLEGIGAFVLHAAIAAVAFWPMVAAPATVGINNDDVQGNTWALTWVGRHLLDPQNLFAANMYYPHPRSLVFTEGLFSQAVQAAPLLALGVSPLLAYNVVMLLTFPLTGFGMYLLARHISGSSLGALVASLPFAFGAYRIEHLVHIQTLSFQWLPLAGLSLLKSLEGPRPAHLTCLLLWTLAQAFSSGYYAALIVPFGAVILAFNVRAPGFRRAAGTLALAGAIVVLAYWPYLSAHQAHGVGRSREECAHWSARWGSYLNPGQARAGPFADLASQLSGGARESLYPGTLVLVFALGSVAFWRHDRSVRVFGTLALVGLALSLGPDVAIGPWVVPGPYELLRRLPGFSSLRAPARMFPLAGLGLCCCAAIAWGRLRLDSRRRAGRVLAVGLLVLAIWEGVPRGLYRLLQPVPAPRPYAHWLSQAPRGPVLELPWDNAANGAGLYLYWSTVHWQWLVNGWGAYGPPESEELAALGRRWPSPRPVRLLRDAGVRYLVIHSDRQTPQAQARFNSGPVPKSATLAFEDGPDRVYRLGP